MTRTYLGVILLFSPAFLLNDITICFVRNDGSPRLAMLAMLGGSLSNVVLDYVFIFPCQMGIFGAVFATGLAPVSALPSCRCTAAGRASPCAAGPSACRSWARSCRSACPRS